MKTKRVFTSRFTFFSLSLSFSTQHAKQKMAEKNNNNKKLSDSKRREFNEHFGTKRDQLPACPKCQTNANVIPTVRGKPSQDLLTYADEGHVKLSGCTQSYNGWCKKCQAFL